MIRVLRALVWLRWRSAVNGLTRGRGRDSLERASRVLRVVAPFLVVLMVLPMSIALAVGGFAGGLIAASRPPVLRGVTAIARVLLGGITAILILAPALRSLERRSSAPSRLLLLPIPPRLLHAADLAASGADPFILWIVPALLALPAGLVAGGRPAAAAVMLAAGILVTAALGLLSSLAGSLLALLFRDRRRGELLAVALLAAVSLSGLLPLWWTPRSDRGRAPGPQNAASRAGRDGSLPESPWTAPLPSELFGRAMRVSVTDPVPAAAIPVAGLALWCAVLYPLSWSAYRRLLESPASSSRRRGPRGRQRALRIPGLSDAESAVAVSQLRAFARTVRGRVAIVTTPLTVVVFGFLARRAMSEGERGFSLLAQGPLLAGAGTFMAILALQPFLLNQFAADRAGLTLQFLLPLSDRAIVRGKSAGLFLAWCCLVIPSFLTAGVLARGGDPAIWTAVLLGGLATLAPLLPVGAVLSAAFPRSADLGRIGSAGNPHPAAAWIGSLLTLALVLPPSAIVAVAFLGGRSRALALSLQVAWLAISLGATFAALRPAALALAARRESLALAAQGR